MRRCFLRLLIVGFLFTSVAMQAEATTLNFGFETSWSGDYAPGWENTAYRHGEPPIGKMMQQVTTARTGSYGMQLVADSTPESWMWWAGVNIANINPEATLKQYDPYFSAYYYDEGDSGVDDPAGQIFGVPSWVNPYITGGEDWTDIQLGARDNVEDNYYYVAVGESHPGWQDSGTARTAGWHELKMQLSSTDGRVHFSVDGNEVGTSYRDDYMDLGSVLGLYTRFAAPLSDWQEKPYTIWDDVEFGSAYPGSATIPEPVSFAVWSLLAMVGFAFAGRRRWK